MSDSKMQFAEHFRAQDAWGRATKEPQFVSAGGDMLEQRGNPNTKIKLAGGRRGAFVSVSNNNVIKARRASESVKVAEVPAQT